MLDMKDILILLILIAVFSGATIYIVRAKKSGQKCIGCPYSKECKGNCNLSDEK